MRWVRARLVRRRWVCTKTSTRCPATSGGTRKTATTACSSTPTGRTKDASFERSRDICQSAFLVVVEVAAMEILFATTELAPFVKVGGLADVSAALPKALKMLGHSVTLVLPHYQALEAG